MRELTLRADKWLWYARFFKSRSQASKFIQNGKVRLNRQRISKPSAALKPGDVLTFALRKQVKIIEIVHLGTRRGPASEARTLYLDLVDTEKLASTQPATDLVEQVPAE